MRILLVEDDPVLREVLSRSLSDNAHLVDATDNMADAQHLWLVQPFDAVLLDLNLPSSRAPASILGNGLDLKIGRAHV